MLDRRGRKLTEWGGGAIPGPGGAAKLPRAPGLGAKAEGAPGCTLPPPAMTLCLGGVWGVNTLLRTGVAGVLTGLSPAKTLPLVGLVGVDAEMTLARVGLPGAEGGGCAATTLPLMGLFGVLADAPLGSPVYIAET